MLVSHREVLRLKSPKFPYKNGSNNLLSLMQLQNRMAVLLCNQKPSRTSGVVSQAAIMCASSQDKVEILDPPSGAAPGDRVTFQGFPGNPTIYYSIKLTTNQPTLGISSDLKECT